MGDWLAESVDEISDPYDKARFEAGYAVLKDPQRPCGLCNAPTRRKMNGVYVCVQCAEPA